MDSIFCSIIGSAKNTLSTLNSGHVAAITGVLAALAAFVSAGIAKKAVSHAKNLELQNLIRQIASIAQNVIDEYYRAQDIFTSISISYKELTMFAGQFGGNRQLTLTKDAEKRLQNLVPLKDQSTDLIDNISSLKSREKELTEIQIKFEGYLHTIKREKDKLSQELHSVESQNSIYRQKAINK